MQRRTAPLVERWTRLLGLMLLVAGLHVPLAAQDDAHAYQAVTASRPSIPVDLLRIQLRPLTESQLEVEANAWLASLRAKIREVSDTETQLQSASGEDALVEPRERLTLLRQEEAKIVERTRAVLDAWQDKGGDTASAEKFIRAVSDITETADAASYWAALRAAVINWMQRDDGGRVWIQRILAAVGILFVAWLLSRVAGRMAAKVLSRYPRASMLLENFARRTAGGTVFVVGVMMALTVLGVQIGPMLAALGAGGFIVGFALQETLGSFASGMMIMVYRPFDVDDYVAVAGVEGNVKEMSLVSTTLLTIDNKVIVIPNKKVWGDTIINYTGNEVRRIDLEFGIGYDDDMQRATDLLTEIASSHALVLEDPKVMVRVHQLADSSVNLFCRPWVKTKDYWPVRWDLIRQVKERFDAEGISIPYPQQDVHMYTHASPAESESAQSERGSA